MDAKFVIKVFMVKLDSDFNLLKVVINLLSVKQRMIIMVWNGIGNLIFHVVNVLMWTKHYFQQENIQTMFSKYYLLLQMIRSPLYFKISPKQIIITINYAYQIRLIKQLGCLISFNKTQLSLIIVPSICLTCFIVKNNLMKYKMIFLLSET